MGDTTDGSSSTAQSAPNEPKDPDPSEITAAPGLFKRLVAAFSPPNAPAVEHTTTAHVPRLGMGNLRSKRVEDVLVPRAEIVSVPLDIAKDELVAVFRESGLTRLPVFKDTLDTPVGMIHLKDLTLKHGFNGMKGKGGRFALKPLVRPVLFVPPSMPIGVLLTKMQTERKHMALVIDEYGGVDGLVTIEDLIEQVIGEIEDEHDIDEADFWKLEKPGCYLVQARAPLKEFEAEIGIRLSDAEMDEEIDTLGGLVFMLTGKIPARGEVVKHPKGPQFEVVDADPRRIKRLRVRLSVPAGE